MKKSKILNDSIRIGLLKEMYKQGLITERQLCELRKNKNA